MLKTLQISLLLLGMWRFNFITARKSFSDNEKQSVLESLIREGDYSQYGLSNAVTHMSQQVDDYDRATELEVIGGKIIDLDSKDWKVIAAA